MKFAFNPHQAQSTSLMAFAQNMLKNRHLIYQMTKREVIGRYKGSVMGLAWSFFNPILMLTIYTIVFSVIFKSRWGNIGSESKTEFAFILFVGMIIYTLFSETLNSAPGLMQVNINYVKKIVFPLEILPVILFLGKLSHALISFSVLLIGLYIFNGSIYWTTFFLPILLFPLVLVTIGLSWVLASIGVFIKDIGQSIGFVTMILIFLSPVFYPISAIPEEYRWLIMLNPLTFEIEQVRDILIFGRQPNFKMLGVYFAASLAVFQLGYFWFQKTKKGFPDVI